MELSLTLSGVLGLLACFCFEISDKMEMKSIAKTRLIAVYTISKDNNSRLVEFHSVQQIEVY